jgi:hypothetical protein
MTDPDDDTQPQPTGGSEPARPGLPLPPALPPLPPLPGPLADPPAPPRGPALRVDPDAPRDSGWREPPWFPPGDRRRRDRNRDRPANGFAVLVGLIFIVVGGWYFLERTLGIDLPRIQWGSLWPLVLIALGGWILIQSIQRRP